MGKDEEIAKAEKIRDKRIILIAIVSLTYLGIAIVIVLFGQNGSPIVTQILIPLTIGIPVGLILSIISIRLSHETSIRLIEIQFAPDEIKKRLANVEEFFGMESNESDIKPERQSTKQNTYTTYGELHWKPILLITIGLGAIGILFVTYGSSQIIYSYNITEPVSHVKFNTTEFDDTFPETPLVSFVRATILNSDNRPLLYMPTNFYVTLETNKEYKSANFEIFHESESKRFNSTQIGPIKQEDGSIVCPHLWPWKYERAFPIPLITGGGSGDNPTFVYSGSSPQYTFTVPGNYRYQVSFLTDDQPAKNCTLISYESQKTFFTVPDEQTEAQIDAYKTGQTQKLEQDQNNARNMGFSYITAGAITIGFSITLLPIVLNRKIKHKN